MTGYFIEVPTSQAKNVPEDFTIKQTLVGGARFVTQELRDFEKKLTEGESILAQREYALFEEIRSTLLENFKMIKEESQNVAFLDFTQSLAMVALENNYCCPQMHTGFDIKILNGRHPVLEQIQRDFISNDLVLSSKDYIHIITGPNM